MSNIIQGDDTMHLSADAMRKYIVKEYRQLIEKEVGVQEAKGNKKVPVALVMAIIAQESKGNPFAIRYEPSYFFWLTNRLTKAAFKDLPGTKLGICSKDTEMKLRACSFGLMQVLGQTARENGFDGIYITELCDVETSIRIGLNYLSKLCNKYEHETHAVAAYNAGSVKLGAGGTIMNQEYIDKVMAHKTQFELLL